jgi:hypothetical protein
VDKWISWNPQLIKKPGRTPKKKKEERREPKNRIGAVVVKIPVIVGG